MGGYECTGCNLFFSGATAFDKHRTGGYGDPIYEKGQTVGYTPHTRRCMTASEMLAAGLVLKNDVWGFPINEQAREYFEKLKEKRSN